MTFAVRALECFLNNQLRYRFIALYICGYWIKESLKVRDCDYKFMKESYLEIPQGTCTNKAGINYEKLKQCISSYDIAWDQNSTL